MSQITQHQNEKIAEVLEILTEKRRVVYKGSAGVGKTYTVDEIISRLRGTKHTLRDIVCCAPTHKALSVLKGKIKSTDVTFQTIHSVLFYKKHTDPRNGKISFRPTPTERNRPLNNVSLLVVDESSMIDTEMLLFLEKFGNNTTIIFIGDSKQVRPVGEKITPVFWGCPTLFDIEGELPMLMPGETLMQYYLDKSKAVRYSPYPEVELTEIIRQGEGNPIITLSRNIDQLKSQVTRIRDDNTGIAYTTNFAKIIYELSLVNGSNTLKYLSYTNDDVDKVNLQVRQAIYGPNPAKIEPLETIIFNAPHKKYVTNQELKVETLNIDTINFNVPVQRGKTGLITRIVPLKCYIINGQLMDEWGDGKKTWKGIFVVHEDSEAAFKQLNFSMNANCSKKLLDYVSRNDFLDNFAEFKYNHALTIHKSQGSTYEATILNVGSIDRCPEDEEKESLAYTAITRASNLLILYNA